MPRRNRRTRRSPSRDRLLASDRRQLLDHGGDERGLPRRRRWWPPLRTEWPTSTAGPPRWRDQGEQVDGDVGAAAGGPVDAGLAAAAQVDRGHPVAGRHQLGDHGAIGLAAVAHAVREHDHQAGPRHLVGDRPAVDGQVLGHGNPQMQPTKLAKAILVGQTCQGETGIRDVRRGSRARPGSNARAAVGGQAHEGAQAACGAGVTCPVLRQ